MPESPGPCRPCSTSLRAVQGSGPGQHRTWARGLTFTVTPSGAAPGLHPPPGDLRAGRLRSWSDGRTAVVLNLLLIGLAIALDPLPLTSFVVVLPSKRGVIKGAAYLFGWLVSLAIVVAVTVLATGNNPPKTEHGALTGVAGGEDRHRNLPCPDRDPAASADAGAEETEEAAQVAAARGQHVAVVRHGPGPGASALDPDRSGSRHRHGGQAVQLGELSRADRVLCPELGVLHRHGDLRLLSDPTRARYS